jgi:hypothetical protein
VNRAEAVALYKEIMNLCEDMRASAVNLIESKSNNPKATGYQVRIRAVLSNESAQQIRGVAEKLNLGVLEENGEVVIYKPKEIAKTN